MDNFLASEFRLGGWSAFILTRAVALLDNPGTGTPDDRGSLKTGFHPLHETLSRHELIDSVRRKPWFLLFGIYYPYLIEKQYKGLVRYV
jgi:hypothetical protein